MKHLLSLAFALIITVVQVNAQATPQHYRTDQQRVIFQPTMNKAALDQIKKDLVNHALTLHYDDLVFSPAGELQGISFHVKESSGRKFEASTDNLAKAGFFGFEFGFVDGKSTVLNVGTLESQP